MRATFESGHPRVDGREAAVVLRSWPTLERADEARETARRWAAEGWHGVWARETPPAALSMAVDAARRAGLAVLVDGEAEVEAPHVARAADLPQGVLCRATTVAEAYLGFLAGARVIAGDLAAVAGLRAYLALASAPAVWEPVDTNGSWVMAGTADEAGAYSAAGGDLRFPIPVGPARAIYWVEPRSGDVLGVATPGPADDHLLRGAAGGELAIYFGPLGQSDRARGEPTRPEDAAL